MQKIVIEKSVAEEIKKKLASYEQVKNEKNACESGEFVEKMQNLALTEENEQKLSKLQGSEIVEKGMKTITVPPTEKRKGYQYQRNFPENKKENVYKGKSKDILSKEIRKLKTCILNYKKNQTIKEKDKIAKDILSCTDVVKVNNQIIKVVPSRNPQKLNKQESEKMGKELLTVSKLKKHGFAVYLPKETPGKKNFDFIIDGVRFELKNLKGTNLNSIEHRYREALEQSSNVIMCFDEEKGILPHFRNFHLMKKAKSTDKNKTCLIIMFRDSDNIYFYDFKEKKGSTEVPPNCNIPQIQKMSRNNTKELQKSLGLNDQEFESYLFSIQGSKIHKSFNVEVTDITENNKYKKVEQVEKTLRAIYNNVPFVINHIDTKGDNSEKYQNITLGITDFNKEKIEKAVHSIALALDVEPNVSNKGEPFLYKAQEEFTNNMIKEILKETKKIYLFVIDYFNLPDIRVISKANLRHKGKIVYNPETGKPITKKEWEKFLKEYEKLCQKIYGNFGEKLVLSSEVVGRMLDKITQKYPMEKVKKMSLKEMENLSKMTVAKLTVPKVFYQTFSKEQYFRNRIELAEMSVTNLITTCNENAKNKIKQILIDGIKNKDNKSKIGQQIFERCVGLNTDIQRIVDTEIQNNVNAAIIRSNVENKKENEKIYFKRSEIIDKVTCKKCKAIKGMVVLFSENPLTDEKIKDQYAEYAIWEGKTEGKVPFATMHPYCRGTWYRYYPRVVKK